MGQGNGKVYEPNITWEEKVMAEIEPSLTLCLTELLKKFKVISSKTEKIELHCIDSKVKVVKVQDSYR